MTSFKLNTYLMCILLFIPGHIQANTLKAAVLKNENFQKRYNEVLGSLSPLEIENFKPTSDGSHLEIIEMIILQQALHLGGLKEPIIFEPHDMANLGEIAPIVDGTILMFGRSMWLQTSVDYQGSLYISEPVIKYGEFEAGLYYNIANKDLKDIKIDALSEFKIVANPRWLADWRALLNSPMTMVNFIGPWENMIAMLDANIVDLMLVNFSVSNDLNMIFKDKLYQPINNLKIVLPDSRHFVVSKRHPRGKEVFEALQKGLTIMRKLGKIRKLYEQAGVMNSKVKNWDIINKQMLVL
ncbi:hypothetical protein KO527_13815 [Pseudoalteromonas sp. C2R02]|uniref:hypothetical protein n=1 Tax=Pseudoalteromonas sp. C2R02 TaxID=2841565 RepID=UPI001C082846|nr:hypothetical protein [Pseudoalteromonas sp. C2R02]MBU2970425.1 hypothetical protein [Pseudoalteromonas sp. C2R02]